MRILVTGLCLSRNLGGPAMALSLVGQLRQRIKGVDFVFAISPNSYVQEKKWADFYGLDIVRKDSVVSYLKSSSFLLGLARKGYRLVRGKRITPQNNPDARAAKEVHREFMAAYESCDAVVDMQGIAYVGDGVKGGWHGLASYSNLYYANKHKKPFAHFIQSFGPFDDWKVRFFAKRDFNQVDFIPARGRVSAKLCREIVSDPSKVYDFPDSAILLRQADSRWTSDYLSGLDLKSKEYVVLSPSAVIYNMKQKVGGSIGEKHIESFALIAKQLLSDNTSILFLPHTYSNNKSECDREICRRILSRLKEGGSDIASCKLIEDDLDVWQAKSLIALSKAAVVSRYHALVAAISTGIPVVTIGWNIKYHDLMEYYGLEDMSVDARKHSPSKVSSKAIEKLSAYYADSAVIETMLSRHQVNVQKVEQGFDMLAEWLMQNANL